MALAKKTKKTPEEREGALMTELCEKFKYTFLANKPGKRVSMMYDRTRKIVEPYYLMQLAVPMDSALGKKMLEMFPTKGNPPKKR